MPYELKEKERLRVVALDRQKRFDHLLERANHVGEVWTLAQGEGIMVLEGEEGGAFVPLWPHHEYATDWVSGAFEGALPEDTDLVAVPTEDLRDGLLTDLATDGIEIIAFPTEEDEGEVLSAADLKKKLRKVRPAEG